LGFFAGAAIITLNFYALARVAPGLAQLAKGAVAPLLFQFYGRLILTGVLLYLLIAWLHVSVIALLAGLSTVIVNALLWATLFYIIGRKGKEA
jgi:predicted membrane channel-forming protein YqfA (hemolysin III family)